MRLGRSKLCTIRTCAAARFCAAVNRRLVRATDLFLFSVAIDRTGSRNTWYSVARTRSRRVLHVTNHTASAVVAFLSGSGVASSFVVLVEVGVGASVL